MNFGQTHEPSAGMDRRRAVPFVCAGLAVAVLLVFGQTLRNGFINFDDDIYAYANPNVAKGLTPNGVIWAFTSCRPAGLWHPVTWLSLMLDGQFYGLNPGGFHLTNVILHAVTVVLFFLLLHRFTGAMWPSALVAAIFAFHPLRVESVAWISERKDLLNGLFFMLTLWTYSKYAQKRFAPVPRSWGLDYGLALFFFALGLLSKSMLVTMPFVLLLLDFWPLQRLSIGDAPAVLPRMLKEKIPFFLLSAAICVITFLTQKSVGAVAPTPPVLRVENALISYWSYIAKMFWPDPLAILYPYPPDLPAWQAVVAGAALLLISALVVLLAGRFRYLFVGWFWYLGMMVPVIGLVQVGGQAMADRFTYLPQVGLCLALVWGMKDLAAHWRIPPLFPAAAAAGLIPVLMACSVNQIAYWRDSESVWAHAIECTAANPIAEIDIGLALVAVGRPEEAIAHYQTAIDIRPDHPYAYLKLAAALTRVGRFDEAITNYEMAVQIRPGDAEAHDNLGALLAQRGRYAEAEGILKEAIRLAPDYAEAHNNLANLLATEGRTDEAVPHYQEALRLMPDYAEANYNFAGVLASRAQFDDAVSHYQKAIAIRLGYAEAYYGLANVLSRQDKVEEAIGLCQKAVQIKPGYVEAHYKLGVLLALRARLEDAAEQFRTVIVLKPDDANGHGNLANVLMGQGKLNEAVSEYRQTVRLEPDSDQAHFKLGLALKQQNQPDAALEEFQTTLRLNPRREDAKTQLRLLGAP